MINKIFLNLGKIRSQSTINYSNNSYDEKYDVLSKMYNNNSRPCETCAGKFYIVKNEIFNKNFSIVRDTVNNLLYLDKVICKTTLKMSKIK